MPFTAHYAQCTSHCPSNPRLKSLMEDKMEDWRTLPAVQLLHELHQLFPGRLLPLGWLHDDAVPAGGRTIPTRHLCRAVVSVTPTRHQRHVHMMTGEAGLELNARLSCQVGRLSMTAYAPRPAPLEPR